MKIEQVAELVKQARLEAGLSQASVSHLADCTVGWVVGFENGRSKHVSAKSMLQVCEALGIPVFTEEKLSSNYLQMVLKLSSEHTKKTIKKDMIEGVFVSRKLPRRVDVHMQYILNEIPPAILIGLVKQLAVKYEIKPKNIWENLSAIANYYDIKTPFWLSI